MILSVVHLSVQELFLNKVTKCIEVMYNVLYRLIRGALGTFYISEVGVLKARDT